MPKIRFRDGTVVEREVALPAFCCGYGGFDTQDLDGTPVVHGGGQMLLTDQSVVHVYMKGYAKAWCEYEVPEDFSHLEFKIELTRGLPEGSFSSHGRDHFEEVLDKVEAFIAHLRAEIAKAKEA